MAVYTHVTQNELVQFLKTYEIGELISFSGITQGVENTNYLIEVGNRATKLGIQATGSTRYILTIFEQRVDLQELPFFLAAMNHFSENGVSAPRVISSKNNTSISELKGKPTVIISFLSGKAVMDPGHEHSACVGDILGVTHNLSDGFTQSRANRLSIKGWDRLVGLCHDADRCAPHLRELIDDEFNFLKEHWPNALPLGLTHLDLFPDNVFFENGQVSGIIDFYFAATEAFAYDLAITLSAWSNINGEWRENNFRAMLMAYEKQRPLNQNEKDAMPVLLRGAALRFLLTRLYDWLNQVPDAVVKVKDPLEYRDILLRYRTSAESLFS
ncbi:MAG: homoserine kinase [Pseudomonadota bacterium]